MELCMCMVGGRMGGCVKMCVWLPRRALLFSIIYDTFCVYYFCDLYMDIVVKDRQF